MRKEGLRSKPGYFTNKGPVAKFIGRFTLNGKRDQVIECFTCGCCYWFAKTLETRFTTERFEEKAFIVYAPIDNHFGCWINGYVYDITGEVTENYQWRSWAQFKKEEPIEAARIEKYCIYMEDVA